jgi:hypothetical protein
VDEKQEKPPGGVELSESEVLAARALPGTYVNRIVASNLPHGMRLTFGELHRSDLTPNFYSAVVMSYEDAFSVRELIDQQLRLAGFSPDPSTEGNEEVVAERK